MQRNSLIILDNALDHTLYRPVEHWARLLNFAPEFVHVPSGRPLPEPGAHSHVIISGSESSVLSPPPWALNEIAWVQLAAQRGVFMLGSCWGHQLIARALGGPRCVRRAITPEFGWRQVQITRQDQLFATAKFSAFTSHFDEVVPSSHPDLTILARSESCAVHALRWGTLPVWGIQSHPEMNSATAHRFLAEASRRWPEHSDLLGHAAAEHPTDSTIAGELLMRFMATTPGSQE